MTVFMTRQQRRQMKRLADAADDAVEGDRRYFARWPNRIYRIRLASHAERKQIELVQGRAIRLNTDQAAFVVMKKLGPGVRMKATVIGPRESVGEELTDAEAGCIYEGYADHHPAIRQREEMMRAAYVRFDGTPPDPQEGGPQQ